MTENNRSSHGFHLMPDAERRKWQDPDVILKEAGLQAGDTFMDIGCGYGFFLLPAARLVGATGLVYGVDISTPGIQSIEASAAREGLRNIKLVNAEAEKTVFCKACGDIIFFGIDLHDFRDPAAVLQNARKMLKTGGRVIDLDWKKQPSPWGPPLEIRFSETKAQQLLETAGFKIESTRDSGPYHYMIIAR